MSKDSEKTHTLTFSGRNWSLTEYADNDGGYRISVDRVKVPIRILAEPSLDNPEVVAEINGRVFATRLLERNGAEYVVRMNDRIFNVGLDAVQAATQSTRGKETSRGPVLVSAPMSGRVVSLNISRESQVTSGQSLVVLEAMKMQNDISAPKSGVVKEIYVQAGTLVKAGEKLCLLQ